ncbi:calponin repeat domain-containing protein, partial [Enterococcus faecium]|uniref:calponin repeat domain-containing protein n=1 Tax=Enterococcus faecium TaxID=1352 RepID=UPI002FEEE993
ADIRADDASREGAGVIGLQAGSNKGASQAGMSFGAQRHIADIKVDDMSQASKASINLQYGSNKGASQTGMSYGGRRDIMGN